MLLFSNKSEILINERKCKSNFKIGKFYSHILKITIFYEFWLGKIFLKWKKFTGDHMSGRRFNVLKGYAGNKNNISLNSNMFSKFVGYCIFQTGN